MEKRKSYEALTESKEKYRTLVEKANEAICILQDGIFIFANRKTCELAGKQKDDLEGKPFIDFVWPEDREMVACTHKKRMAGETLPDRLEFRVIDSEGSPLWLSVSIAEIQHKGKPATLNLATDITERRQFEKLLEEKTETAQRYLNVAAEIIISLDRSGDIILLNDSGHKILGYDLNELIGKNWFKTCLPDEVISEVSDVFEKVINGNVKIVENYENEVKTKNGETKTILWHNAVLKDPDGKIAGLVSSGLDITERKKAEAQVLQLSFHDYLTGLYNRRFFEEELKRLDSPRQFPLGIIMGDLNGLKIINDAFGHSEGDRLLKYTAKILKMACRSDDIIARWGGDEFAILLPKTSPADSEEIASRIRSRCKKTEKYRIPLSLSLGSATKNTKTQNIQEVIIDAENNMYKNKLDQKDSIASSIISALERTLYEKSLETKGHTNRVKELSLKLGRSINLSSSQLDELSLLSSLHDLGKIAIPETVLLKEGELTKKEWEIIKRHPEIGYNIASSSAQISHIARAILACHENFDGSGYPRGLSGESIPVISRITLIADAYDVMTIGRVYREALSISDAIEELKRCAGTKFDLELTDNFIDIITEEKKATHNYKEKVL